MRCPGQRHTDVLGRDAVGGGVARGAL